MKVLMTKASDDYWYQIREVSDIKTLYDEIGKFVVGFNLNKRTKPSDLCRFWDGMTLEDAKQISKIELKITIYDDYLE